MRKPGPIVYLLLVLALAGCGRSQDQIVGKWKGETSSTVWEFLDKGVVNNGNTSGRYSFGDSHRLKIQMPAATFVYEIDLKEDRMIWKDPNGSQTELRRVR
jgi:hypothetical protein